MLGSTSKILASIDATTRLLDDEPMGRRREPRHPVGAGEREDRERLKRQHKRSKKLLKQRSDLDDEVMTVNSDEEDNDDVDGTDPLVRGGGGGKAGRGGPAIDIFAEAGGMGLLLVPLTPEDMRANYPEDFRERCGEDIAYAAGAVAFAEMVEEQLKAARLMKEGDGEEEEGEEGGDGEGGHEGADEGRAGKS